MNKTISMSIRVSEEELDKLKQAARIEAYASYSEFVRRTALKESDRVIKRNERENTLKEDSDKYIREYILKQCRLLAVVGLHGNTFKNGKSGTGTKTSVLFVQKWTDEDCGYPNICPKPDADENGNIDYPIFFATMQEPSKDNSGDKIYVTETYVNWTSYKYTTVKL